MQATWSLYVVLLVSELEWDVGGEKDGWSPENLGRLWPLYTLHVSWAAARRRVLEGRCDL